MQDHYCFQDGSDAKPGHVKSCALTALFELEKNDVIGIINQYGAKIERVETATFFGAVKLSWSQTNSMSKV